VIPPAWKKVWICPYPNGHIQTVGSDVAGRRQYLYHQQWQEERNEEKFDQVLEMSAELPDMRRHIVADLRRRGLERDRVLALALHLLDLGYFRSGSEQYTEENNSYGIATLLCEHVTVHKEAVEFDYPAKSGVRRTLQVEDPEVVRSVAGAAARQAQRRPILGVSQRFRVGRPATRTTSTRDSKNLSGTDTPSKTYAPGTARCWAPQPSSARIPR
jgi:DNA topoisomerase I